jgi:hypothetical protein
LGGPAGCRAAAARWGVVAAGGRRQGTAPVETFFWTLNYSHCTYVSREIRWAGSSPRLNGLRFGFGSVCVRSASRSVRSAALPYHSDGDGSGADPWTAWVSCGRKPRGRRPRTPGCRPSAALRVGLRVSQRALRAEPTKRAARPVTPRRPSRSDALSRPGSATSAGERDRRPEGPLPVAGAVHSAVLSPWIRRTVRNRQSGGDECCSTDAPDLGLNREPRDRAVPLVRCLGRQARST